MVTVEVVMGVYRLLGQREAAFMMRKLREADRVAVYREVSCEYGWEALAVFQSTVRSLPEVIPEVGLDTGSGHA